MNIKKLFQQDMQSSQQEKKVDKRQKITFMVGLPGVGKSTYINNYLEDSYIISNDDIRTEIAKENGFTYDDTFERVPEEKQEGEIHEKYGEITLEYPTWMGEKRKKEIENGEAAQPWEKPFLQYKKIVEINKEIAKKFQERINNAKNQDKEIIIDMTMMVKDGPTGRIATLQQITGMEDITEIKKKYEVSVIDMKINKRDLEELKIIAAIREHEITKEGGSKHIPSQVYDRMLESYQNPKEDGIFENYQEWEQNGHALTKRIVSLVKKNPDFKCPEEFKERFEEIKSKGGRKKRRRNSIDLE